MSFAHFQQLNSALVEAGDAPMQNPRNTTSGTLKLQNPQEVSRRKLSFAAHYLISDNHNQSQSSHYVLVWFG